MTSISVEFCAYSVAIALECRPIHPRNKKWCIYSLVAELKGIEHSEHRNFHVDLLALHQGMIIFKKPIERLGHQIIPMSAGHNQFRTAAFMDLEAKARASDIIFSSLDPNVSMTQDELVAAIGKTANILLNRTFSVTSKYSSISEICGDLWLAQLRESSVVTTGSKRRKLGDELGGRQLIRLGNQVREYKTENICVENESPFSYITAAVKLSISKNIENLDSIRKSIFDDDILEEEEDSIRILSHSSVVDGLLDFPKQYIKFSCHEKEKVISLFDVIATARAEIDGEKYRTDDSFNAIITKKALSKRAHYSELLPTSIMRWSKNREDVKKETGRKISTDFEADIWGKLMICEFEKIIVSHI